MARRHKDAVYAQMIRVCGNRDDAEDVLVEALLSAHRAIGQLRDEAGFRPWLARIGRRVCSKLKRKKALEPILRLSEIDAPSAPDAGTDPDFAVMKTCVESALGSLPDIYRETFLLDLEGMTAGEIGQRLGISNAAVKSRLHRARAIVRRMLDRDICVLEPD